MIISIHDVWNAAAVDHEKYVRAAMNKAWKKLLKIGPPTSILVQVCSFIDKHNTEIVGAGTRNYALSVADYDAQFLLGTPARKEANSILEKLFDYDRFRNADKGWSAYSLCKTSSYVVCPYCHLIPTNTEQEDSQQKGYRPQLDHFIGQADYPFLALSLGNLVPCCAICNGPTMKHTTNVLTAPLLFPLAHPEALAFRLRPKGGQPWSPLLRAVRVPLDQYEIEIEAPYGNVAAQNSLKTFQLRSRYQPFLHDAYRLAMVGRNSAWQQTIMSMLGFAPSLKDNLGFSNAAGCTEFKNVPQGKMRLDVYNDSRNW